VPPGTAVGAIEAAVLLLVHVTVSAESIFGKTPSKKQKAVLARVARRQAVGDDAGIDYSDIPALTDEQLAGFKGAPKVLVAARLDRDVVDWLKKYGEGYSTRINFILREAMARVRSEARADAKAARPRRRFDSPPH
jgi:uncharacterized protein (DUF4415 family)